MATSRTPGSTAAMRLRMSVRAMYVGVASPTAAWSAAGAKHARYQSRSPARSSRSKKASSFSGGIQTSGWARSQSDIDVVPHLGAPTIRKLGSRPAMASPQLRRPPRRRQAPAQLVREVVDRHALLAQRVAVADGDRAVLERLVVDGHAERRADLVLAPVALADRAALVVLGLHAAAQRGVHLARDLGQAVLAHDGQDGDLHRREQRAQLEHRALGAAERVLVGGGDEERERGAVRAGGGLDDVRDVALAGRRVEVLELLAAVLRVLGE